MESRSIETIFRALNAHQIRYLIVGGLAVVAHGYVRFTADVDLILAFEQENLLQAIAVLRSLDYRPRAPVSFEDFADPVKRLEWQQTKGMTVFSLFSSSHPATEIDLYIESPLDFAAAHAQAICVEIAPGVTGTICSLSDLLKMKAAAGRPRDLEDISQLRRIHLTRNP